MGLPEIPADWRLRQKDHRKIVASLENLGSPTHRQETNKSMRKKKFRSSKTEPFFKYMEKIGGVVLN